MNSNNNIDISITFDENIEIIVEKEEPEQVNASQTIIEENLNNFPFPFPEETSSITIKLHIFNSNIDTYKNIVINTNINNRELHYLVYQKMDLLDISMIERIYYNDIIVPFNPEENVAGQITESEELLILINDDFQTHNSINFLSSSDNHNVNISNFLYQIRNHISNNINVQGGVTVINKLTQQEIDSIKEEKITNIVEEEKCGICYNHFKMDEIIKVLNCKHIFHKNCISPWLLNYSRKCPFCKCVTL